MAPPSASATRRTRWIQGSIIAASAVTIIWATVTIAERSTRPASLTTPVVTTSHLVITSTVLLEPAPAPVEASSPAERPVPGVAASTTEAPSATPAAAVPTTVTYENCAEVWADIGGPIHRGDPGYNSELDSDHDGTGCEHKP